MSSLTIAWARGWATSRGTPPPVPVPGGLLITHARNVARYVLHAYDWPGVARLGRELTVPGTEIKLVGALSRLHQALPADWKMYDQHHLMTAPFTRGVAEVPAPCTARIVTDGPVLVATVHDSTGAIVSSARLAPCGEFGIIDRVRTRRAEQRRGLGRAVMTLLGNRALDEGLTTGLLSATADGQALYSALGWSIRGELAGAVRS